MKLLYYIDVQLYVLMYYIDVQFFHGTPNSRETGASEYRPISDWRSLQLEVFTICHLLGFVNI